MYIMRMWQPCMYVIARSLILYHCVSLVIAYWLLYNIGKRMYAKEGRREEKHVFPDQQYHGNGDNDVSCVKRLMTGLYVYNSSAWRIA